MNRCDKCMHRDNCICVPYGCEAFEFDLSEHDKQIRADAINEFVTRFEEQYSRMTINIGEFRKYQYEMHRLAEEMIKE